MKIGDVVRITYPYAVMDRCAPGDVGVLVDMIEVRHIIYYVRVLRTGQIARFDYRTSLEVVEVVDEQD